MGAAKIPRRLLYDALVNAYKKQPGRHHVAARVAGCSYPTARLYWEKGCPGEEDCGAIRDMIGKEMDVAKAQRAQDAQLEEPESKELIKTDAAKTRAKLAKLCEAARDVTMANFSVLADQLRAVQRLTLQINRDLLALGGRPADPKHGLEAVTGNPWLDVEQVKQNGDWVVTKRKRVSPKEMIEIQNLVASTTNKLVRAALYALQMERLHLGLPTAIIGHDDMTFDEAVREIETAAAEVQQLKQAAPELFVLQGGKTA